MNTTYTKSKDIKDLAEKVFYEDLESGSQFRVRLCEFGEGATSKIRAGVSRFFWNPFAKKWFPTPKSHCYFSIEALRELPKALEEVLKVANAFDVFNGQKVAQSRLLIPLRVKFYSLH